MDLDADLYERDFVTWTQVQAERLRAAATGRPNLPIDWEHVAEEIEDLGKRDRRDLASRLQTIVLHLMKLQHSPSHDPRGGWESTVEEARSVAEFILRDSPSLRPQVGSLLFDATERARRIAQASLHNHGEADAAARVADAPAFTEDQVLGDWWPERASAAGTARRPGVRSRSRRS
jgi:hypothetical protein